MSENTIIELSDKFTSNHAVITAIVNRPTWKHDDFNETSAASHDTIQGLIDTPATTLAGWKAKARVLDLLDGDHPELAASLARDLGRAAS